jgi:hypothetical protein
MLTLESALQSSDDLKKVYSSGKRVESGELSIKPSSSVISINSGKTLSVLDSNRQSF